MDPYLEGSLWMSVHSQLTAEIARQLAPQIRPRYLALTTERFVWSTPDDVAVTTSGIYPDVSVATTGRDGARTAQTAVAPIPLRIATVMPEPVPHLTVEIRDTANRRLVTTIEVLSPTNKRADGRDEYLAKRARILRSTAHLVEIDLLRQGQRVPMREPLPEAPYFVFVSRVEDRPLTDVLPIRLDQPLPEVPIPLLAGDRDARLDLQQALSNVYDLLGYDLAIDYTKPPEVLLRPEEAAWAEGRLQTGRS
jgi:hypothetical protein